MLPFSVELRPGASPFRETVHAATRAIVSGELGPGTPFPSVRELSQALKINPNTAHKVVAELSRIGLLEIHPGIGTVVVSKLPPPPPAEVEALLGRTLDEVLVEARRLGLSRQEVLDAVASRWEALLSPDPPSERPENDP